MAESQYNADSAHNPDPLLKNDDVGPAVSRPSGRAVALPPRASSVIITSSHN